MVKFLELLDLRAYKCFWNAPQQLSKLGQPQICNIGQDMQLGLVNNKEELLLKGREQRGNNEKSFQFHEVIMNSLVPISVQRLAFRV